MKLLKEWQIDKLGNPKIAITTSGGTPNRGIKEYYGGDIPWVKSGELRETIIIDTEEKITPAGLKNSSAKLFPKNTVLIALYGATVGRTALLGVDATTNQAVCGINPNKDKLHYKFLYYYLQTKKESLIKKSFGGAQPNISQAIIRNLNIPIPPIKTQKQIISILERAEKLKEKRKHANELTKQLPQSLFLEMFGDPNNSNYPVKSIEDVCEKVTDGTHKTPEYVESGIPFLRVTDLTKSNDSKKFIREEEHKELIKRCKPEKGDVLYTKNGTIGVAKMVDWDYEFSIFVSLCLLKPKKEIVLPEYLETFLNTHFALEQAMSHSKKGTITNLHLIEIKKIKLPLPSIKEQEKFIKKIKQIQSIRIKQENSEKEINLLFDS